MSREKFEQKSGKFGVYTHGQLSHGADNSGNSHLFIIMWSVLGGVTHVKHRSVGS